MKRYGLSVVAALALAALPALAAAAEGKFERTLKVTGAVDLDIQTGAGSIQIRSGDAATVRILGTIRARGDWRDDRDVEERVRRLESNPPIEQNGNSIRIGHLDDRESQRNISISYEVSVPAETRVRSHTGSG